ncbi:MAG: hypothetical protein AUH86_19105 [Acidobacteria bacterium 13_1_40CM_4_58_4]|nr:MAG: hypothetical protein AUH86_19105 [Acidobacteria bacterium 13_1_40CM_4_58_4]
MQSLLFPVTHFDQAQTACAIGLQRVVVTQRRNWDSEEAARFQDSRAAFDFHLDAVNGQRGHRILL